MGQAAGYWAKKEGSKVVIYPVSTHIDYIIDHPDKFKVDKEYIEKTYKKHNERMRSEGKAREEIIRKVSGNGWIRIRHYTGRNDYWSIQFDKWASRKRTIKSFIEEAIYGKKSIMSQGDSLVLLGYEDNFRKEYSFQEGGAKSFVNENSLLESYEVVFYGYSSIISILKESIK